MTTWDKDGRGCGFSTPTKDYPYLYFPTIDYKAAQKAAQSSSSSSAMSSVSDILQFSTCVKECPKGTADEVVQCAPPSFMTSTSGKKYYKDCVFYIGGTQYDKPLRYETALFGSRWCVPSSKAMETEVVAQFKAEFDKYFGGLNLAGYLADIVAAREVLYWALLTAFLIGFVYLVVLRLCGGPIVYATIVAMIIGTAYGGFMLYQTSMAMTDTEKYKPYYLYGSYVVWGLAGILLCCILCNLKNIRIGVAIMKCTAQYIQHNPQVFLVPPIGSVIIILWLFVYIIMVAYIVSVGEATQREGTLSFLTTIKWDESTQYVFLYSLFGYLWMNAFMIGVTQFIISASVAMWYFSSTSDAPGSGSLLRGLYWVFRYHLGSIAVGSFLIAVVQFIRIIFEYYKSQLDKAKDNQVVKVLLCLTSYLLDCLERFIKFISKNAYIQIALTGKNFCNAAWNAFCLILKNALRFGTANSIGFVFVLLGVSFIACANGLVVYVMLHYVPMYQGLVSNWIGPTIIGILQGLLIGNMFMSVYSFASDTVLQSFLVDEELKRP